MKINKELTSLYKKTGDIYDFKNLENRFNKLWTNLINSSSILTKNDLVVSKKNHPKKLIRDFIHNEINKIL